MDSPHYRFGPQVRYTPWVGDQYSWQPANERFLIVGESHYGGSDSGLTIEVITNQQAGTTIGYLTRVSSVVSGKRLAGNEREQFWNTVAFCNFIQRPLRKPRIPPTDKMLKEARGPLLEVLRVLKPRFVLFTGQRLWDHLPDVDEGWIYRINTPSRQVCQTRLPDGHIFLSTFIKHPSWPGFGSFVPWHHKVRKFRSMAIA